MALRVCGQTLEVWDEVANFSKGAIASHCCRRTLRSTDKRSCKIVIFYRVCGDCHLFPVLETRKCWAPVWKEGRRFRRRGSKFENTKERAKSFPRRTNMRASTDLLESNERDEDDKGKEQDSVDDNSAFEGPHAVKLNEEVACEVETVSWRERRITASILVKAAEDAVWNVLTDYERLAEFIPNLVCSERIPCPHPGRVWLLQRGRQTTMYWHIEAHVVLDLQELPNLESGKELRFSMVDGDFKHYEGKWFLRSGPRYQTTLLQYEVNVIPRLLFPAAFVEQIIRSDLPVNLRALADRAESDYNSQKKSYSLSNDPLQELISNSNIDLDSSATMTTATSSASIENLRMATRQFPAFTDNIGAGAHIFSLNSIDSKFPSDLNDTDHHWAGIGKSCELVCHCVADEIHFRRLDDLLENGGVHRRVVATITVKAPPQEVWAVLTDYESLPEFVPNLASSKVLFRESNSLRLLQEGCKCLLYMVLHARVILDLCERPGYEITFKQVEGDFDAFQGKWTLEQFGSQHTLLKYVVETKMRKDCLLAEAIVEEVIYEDLPSNLCAIRDRVELFSRTGFEALDDSSEAVVPPHQNYQLSEDSRGEQREANTKVSPGFHRRRRPHVLGLKNDFKILEKELRSFIANNGQDGVMPMRSFLREHGRVDLEKAITGMGGFRLIAARMKLTLAYEGRKPKGYWDKLQNLKQEVNLFQKEIGVEETIMPSRKSMEKAGRYDLARALEKWGGSHEVARILGLKTRKGSQCSPKQASKKKQSRKNAETKGGVFSQQMRAPSSSSKEETKKPARDFPKHSVGPKEVHTKMPYKTDVPQESSKWLTLLRDAQLNFTDD